MKKIFSITTVAVAALLVSCNKEIPETAVPTPEQTAKPGIPASFTIGVPELGEEETKVSGEATSGNKKYKFQWEEGDTIRIFAFETAEKKADSKILDCGPFIAQTSGEKVEFKGTLPDALKTLRYTKVYAISNPGNQYTYNWSTSAKYSVANVTVNSEQDGSAFKYCQFASTGFTLEYADDGTPSFGSVGKMLLGLPVLRLDLSEIGEDNTVYKIVIRCDYSGSKTLNITGGVIYATNSTAVNSGGSSKYVTIYNEGNKLGPEVLVATRHTKGGNDDYGYAILNIAFYYRDKDGNENVDLKVLPLATFGTDGAVKTYKNVAGGTIYNLPAIKSLGSDGLTKTIKWDYSSKIVAPADSSYKGFPWVNSASVGAIMSLKDGEDGDELWNSSTGPTDYWKTFCPTRNYYFNGTLLEIGPNLKATTECFYHNPESTGWLRMSGSCIKIPAYPFYKLTRVKTTVENTSNAEVGIYTTNSISSSKKVTSGNVTKDNPGDFELTDTKAGTEYYFYPQSRYVTSFEFDYEFTI